MLARFYPEVRQGEHRGYAPGPIGPPWRQILDEYIKLTSVDGDDDRDLRYL